MGLHRHERNYKCLRRRTCKKIKYLDLYVYRDSMTIRFLFLLVVFLSIMRVEEVKGHLRALEPARRYQAQCLILNEITEKTYDLGTKTEVFWEHVKEDKKSWERHYESVDALKKAFLAASKMIKDAKRARNTYEEALKRIDLLWESEKIVFAREQSMQILRSMRSCVVRELTMS